jgi:hypothetical protein
MTLLFKVEAVFDISGRGRVIAPAVPAGADFSIRVNDQVQLRTPDGRVLDTHIASIDFLNPQDGSTCRMAIMLPHDLAKQNIPTGTEVWLA